MPVKEEEERSLISLVGHLGPLDVDPDRNDSRDRCLPEGWCLHQSTRAQPAQPAIFGSRSPSIGIDSLGIPILVPSSFNC